MKRFTLVSTYKKLLADTVTPVSIYLKLRDQFQGSILLESSDYHSRTDSFSYICCESLASFTVENGIATTKLPDGSRETCPISETQTAPGLLSEFARAFHSPASPFKFITNGLFGFTAYDAVQYFEDLSLNAPQNPQKSTPEIHYDVFRFVIAIDHFHNELYIFDHQIEGAPVDAHSLDSLTSLIQNRNFPTYQFETAGAETTNMEDAFFLDMVNKGKEHCARGDVFQMVLSRGFCQEFQGDEFNVYRALRAVNPSPYLFFFDYGNFKIFGSSPEAQLTVRDGVAGIHPIAGTYRRTGDDKQDAELAKALQKDPKESAEHVMLVDLARNDLSRNATHVRVESFSEIQYFSHVIHMVSKVTGTVDPTHTPQIVADTFPAGTLSGAPKHRAMQLIDQYEPQKRGFYGGAIGFMGFNGDFNHAIMIRSFLSKNNRLFYQAGAGVVISSQPESELKEVDNKIAALRAAIQNATAL